MCASLSSIMRTFIYTFLLGGTTLRQDRSLTSSIIVRSRNFGQTWRETFRGSGVLYGVQVYSRSFAVVVGVSLSAKALIYRSTDAGKPK